SNLKEIKRVVKSIGDEDLDIEIKSNTYTVEVNDLMHELDEMRKRLKHNEQLKNEMVHNISHDLKTPISIIKMCSESIIDEIYPYGTVEATAKVINEQAERLEKKVTNLLYLNHLTHLIEHEADGQQTAFELKPLILSVVKYMEENHPSINFEINLDKSHVLGDEEKWRVVFENLIANSQRFAATKIRITLINNSIEIYNDGPPIIESEFGSIFKPFEVGVGGVTGLGLSIVHKTLTLYHYSISYENLSTGIKFILAPKQT
ncbi:MAG: sensor histidine kinase, partial [Turicibacter sp.]